MKNIADKFYGDYFTTTHVAQVGTGTTCPNVPYLVLNTSLEVYAFLFSNKHKCPTA